MATPIFDDENNGLVDHDDVANNEYGAIPCGANGDSDDIVQPDIAVESDTAVSLDVNFPMFYLNEIRVDGRDR